MNSKVKGLIVEIGGDTSGLLTSIKNAEKVINSFGSELKEINKLLKFDPKNKTLLDQKSTALSESIESTKVKLEGLKKSQEEYDRQGLDNSTEAYRKVQREIIQTEQDLKKLNYQASDWGQVSAKLGELSTKFGSFGESLTKIGKKLTTNLTVPIVAVGTLATKSAIDFESAFTGVTKTVDGTASELNNLREGIRKMAKEIPSSTTEIAKVSELAGQLGIKTKDIESFTRVMIDLGVSTNISAEEGASALAKFANVTNMSAKDYSRLGSVIVDLGNHFATTEKDIVDMGTRLGSTAKLIGISQAETMALATALSSLGVDSEVGATAFTKLMKKIQLAVETGNKDLKDFAKVSGMTADEFVEDYGKSATRSNGKICQRFKRYKQKWKICNCYS